MATSKKEMTEKEWALLQNVGDMFRTIRNNEGLTQREAASLLGTCQARLPVLENGQADVMLTTLSRFADVYGYDIEIALVPIEDAEEDEFDKALREHAEEQGNVA